MASNRARPAFTQADRNRDGVLDRHEFRNFMNFESADRNRDGRLNVQEFARHAGICSHSLCPVRDDASLPFFVQHRNFMFDLNRQTKPFA